MNVMNRRNAVLGWATWAVLKQVLKRGARARAAEPDEETRRLSRLRRSEPQVEEKPKRKRRLVGFVVATAVGVGVWLSSRRSKENGELE